MEILFCLCVWCQKTGQKTLGQAFILKYRGFFSTIDLTIHRYNFGQLSQWHQKAIVVNVEQSLQNVHVIIKIC